MHPHHLFLNRCLTLAHQAVACGNHPFGAILVHENQIILEAQNEVHTRQDVTAHAEFLLVQKAQGLSAKLLSEVTLYTSTEPCSMCAGAIYWSGIHQVVYGCSKEELAHIAGPGPKKTQVERGSEDLKFVRIHQRFW